MPPNPITRLPVLGLGALLASACAVTGALPDPASAQPTESLDRPGIDYYPNWMLEGNPHIPGQDQDYKVWEDDRFDRFDPDFLEWRQEQRRRYGPDWRSRPGYESDLREWLESR